MLLPYNFFPVPQVDAVLWHDNTAPQQVGEMTVGVLCRSPYSTDGRHVFYHILRYGRHTVLIDGLDANDMATFIKGSDDILRHVALAYFHAVNLDVKAVDIAVVHSLSMSILRSHGKVINLSQEGVGGSVVYCQAHLFSSIDGQVGAVDGPLCAAEFLHAANGGEVVRPCTTVTDAEFYRLRVQLRG